MKNVSSAKNQMYVEIRRYWIYGLFSLLFMLFMQIIGLIPPQIMKKIIDIYIPSGDMDKTYMSIALLCGIPLITTLTNIIYNYRLMVKVKKFAFDIRQKIFLNLLKQPMSFFNNSKAAELATYCTKDTTEFVVFWLIDIPSIICSIIVFLIVSYILFDISILITTIQLVSIPLILIPIGMLGKKLKYYAKQIIELNAETNHLVTESFKGIRLIKSTCSEYTRISLLNKINKSIMYLWGKTVAIERLHGDWPQKFISTTFTGLGFAIGAIQVINKNISIGELIAYITYLPRFYNLISEIASTNLKFNKQIAEHEKTFHFLSIDNEYENNDKLLRVSEDMKGNISFCNVSFKYPGSSKKILDNISFDIIPRKLNIVIGQSGVGKSTMFDLIMKFYNPISGDILIDGKNINDLSIESIRNNIALVSQEVFLITGTIRENLYLAKPDATEKEVDQALTDANIIELVNSLPNGLDTNLGENGAKLSGGEKQRIVLAMALLRKCKILLLDEVSSNLDLDSEAAIYSTIKRIIEKNNITVISITHRNTFIGDAAQIISFNNGKCNVTINNIA